MVSLKRQPLGPKGRFHKAQRLKETLHFLQVNALAYYP